MTSRTLASRLALITLPAALLLGSCGTGGSTGEGAGAGADDGAEDAGRTVGAQEQAADGELELIASFYPLEYLTERVAGEHATVSTLTSPGVDPHDVELTPRVVGSLGSADLVIYADGMQPAVDQAVHTQALDHALDVTEAADLLALGEADDDHDGHDHDDHADDDDHDEHDDEADEHAHDDHAHETEDHSDDVQGDDGHDGHDHGPEDPHFWLDPERYGDVAEAIADELGRIDPDNAEAYASNAAQVVADLDALDEEFAAGLAQCEQRDLVTTHDAFGYLAHRYDLHPMGITGISPESEPSPARLAEVAAQVDELGVGTIFTEPLLPPDIAETVARETGAQVLILDPVEGITDGSAGADYLAVMRANLDSLQEGLSCR